MAIKSALFIDYLQGKLKSTPIFSQTDMSSSMVPLKAGLIRIVTVGKGSQSIMLAPDGPCGIEHDAELIALLSKKYRVVIFEPPGFGYSRPSRHYNHTLEEGIQFLNDVFTVTHTQSAILALPCVAGLIAVGYALRFPQKVDGLIAIQTPCWDDYLRWVNTVDKFHFARTPVIGQLGFWALSPFIQKQWYTIAEPDKKLRQKIITTHESRNQKSCVFCFTSTLQSLKGPDPFSGKIISKPSAILWGTKDLTHRKTPPHSIKLYLPDAKIFEVPKAGHFPELTSPETFMQAAEHIA